MGGPKITHLHRSLTEHSRLPWSVRVEEGLQGILRTKQVTEMDKHLPNSLLTHASSQAGGLSFFLLAPLSTYLLAYIYSSFPFFPGSGPTPTFKSLCSNAIPLSWLSQTIRRSSKKGCTEDSLLGQFCACMLSHVWLFVAHQAPLSMDSPGKNTGVGCHFLLHRIFPTQGSSLHLLH